MKTGQNQTLPLAPRGLFHKKKEMGCLQEHKVARDSTSPEIQQRSQAEEPDPREGVWHTEPEGCSQLVKGRLAMLQLFVCVSETGPSKKGKQAA